jgi:glutathione peroxidase
MKLINIKNIIIITLLVGLTTCSGNKKDNKMSGKNTYDYSAVRLLGEKESFKKYNNKVILVVNTASECGFTNQYSGLQKLYNKYQEKGFVVLGFPSNQFGDQEPGTAKEIQEFCNINYAVTFPMFEKIEVNGENTHPFYKYLKDNVGNHEDIAWNFTKFLIDKNGKVIQRFDTKVEPIELEDEIENLLANKY